MDIIKENGGFKLTFNNITKICCDKIFCDKEEHILDFQYYPDQLRAMCDILNIEYTNPISGNMYSNTILGEKIKKELARNTPDFTKYKETLQNYGLTQEQKSLPIQVPQSKYIRLNTYKTAVEMVTDKSYFMPELTTSGFIKNCNNIGYLENYDGTRCYMDVIFMALCMNTSKNKFSQLIRFQLTNNRLDDELKEVKQIYDHINQQQSKAFNVKQYVRQLDKHHYFKEKGQRDSPEFLHYLIDKILGENNHYVSFNKTIEYWAYTKNIEDVENRFKSPEYVKYSPDPKTLSNPELEIGNIIKKNVKKSIPGHFGLVIADSITPPKNNIDLNHFLSRQILNIGDTLQFKKDSLWEKKEKDGEFYLYHEKDDIKLPLDFDSTKGYKLKDLPKYTNKIKYDNKTIAINSNISIEQIQITKARLLILPITRFPDMNKPLLDYEVYIPETISLKNNDKQLHLNSIVAFQGKDNTGHYYLYFECNGNWYKYNDISNENSIKKVSNNYEHLISKSKESKYIKRFSTLCFYS